MLQSNKLSAGWVVVLGTIQSEAGRARSAPRLAGSCSSHSEINLPVSQSSSDYQNAVEEHKQRVYETRINLARCVLYFVTTLKSCLMDPRLG